MHYTLLTKGDFVHIYINTLSNPLKNFSDDL